MEHAQIITRNALALGYYPEYDEGEPHALDIDRKDDWKKILNRL